VENSIVAGARGGTRNRGNKRPGFGSQGGGNQKVTAITDGDRVGGKIFGKNRKGQKGTVAGFEDAGIKSICGAPICLLWDNVKREGGA